MTDSMYHVSQVKSHSSQFAPVGYSPVSGRFHIITTLLSLVAKAETVSSSEPGVKVFCQWDQKSTGKVKRHSLSGPWDSSVIWAI